MTDKSKMPAGVPDLTQKEVEDAKREGAVEYIKEGGKATMASDTGTTGDAEADADRARFEVAPDLATTFIAPLLDLSLTDLKSRLKSKKDDAIGFEVAKGLLALERAGRNRTGYVKALCDAIGVDSPYEVTTAGPPYTNDETAVSAL